MSETYPAAPLQENLLWHRPFCDSCRNWCSCVLNTGLAHTARKDVYQRTILPNLPRKILSPINPLAVYSLGESGAVEIQASTRYQAQVTQPRWKKANPQNRLHRVASRPELLIPGTTARPDQSESGFPRRTGRGSLTH